MRLLIVESPAKAKTISKYLEGKFTVKASVGHVRDLPKSNKNAIDIEHGFIPHYEIIKGKEKIVDEIHDLAKRAEEVILATDPDREGEAIAWHIAQACGLINPKSETRNSKLKRIVFHEITKEAVEEALNHARPIDEDLRQAQEARRVLDRLFGYDLSGLIWRKLRYGLSAGRVQSPALRILVEREREIKAFIPEKFWVIDARFSTSVGKASPAPDQREGGQEFAAVCSTQPKTEAEAKTIVERSQKTAWQIAGIEKKEMRRAPRAPFTTSTLQQAASSRLGLSPSMTMRLAQKLYEAGAITYMRTDSTNLSQQALGEIAGVVREKFGERYAATRTYQTKVKNAQEAHEAIRPTHATVPSAGHSVQEKKLYQLIWRRAVASQMSDAVLSKTKFTIKANDTTIPDFEATGSIIKFDGWLKVDPAARGEENELPSVEAKEKLTLKHISDTGKQTEPPNRYSEAGLIKELEKRGIGRPSTYAPIIQTLLGRGYAEKEQRSLKATDLGEVVSGFLEEHFTHYVSDGFTKEMEDNLDEIAVGKKDYQTILKDFYGPFTKAIGAKKNVPKISDLGAAPAEFKCPVCGGPMIIKLGRSGKFLSCARFPECQGARMINGQELAGPKETGELCPECKTGKLIEREGRFGKFIACANYPKCKYIKKDESLNGPGSAADSGVKCPLCNKGTMLEKRGRYGVFYGCSNYPACKNIVKTKPTGQLCPLCGALMMTGTKTIPERCSNKTCPNHNPHKLMSKPETA